jgi:AraC family transcriptional regulator of adaptative response/methylated-DNA-[protein]-cysteine methyltransferase
MKIRYTIVDCSLGKFLIGATERGICAITFASSEAQVKAALRREYPSAEIVLDDKGLQRWASAFLKYLQGQHSRLDLPLDIQGTAFQQRVWKELQRIPYGQTRSYSEIAQAIGQPKAVRAVARACAANPVPILIPCHRVIRKNGALGGYSGGIARKRALLMLEEGASL